MCHVLSVAEYDAGGDDLTRIFCPDIVSVNAVRQEEFVATDGMFWTVPYRRGRSLGRAHILNIQCLLSGFFGVTVVCAMIH